MELLSEIIALDDAAKKRVADAQALAESLRQKGLSDRKELEEQNEKSSPHSGRKALRTRKRRLRRLKRTPTCMKGKNVQSLTSCSQRTRTG